MLIKAISQEILIKSQFIIVMNSEPQVQENHNILSEEPQKPLAEGREDRGSSQFEKNYPKNIFIPIIEYLADLGLREKYELAVGTREQFQGKNVVSLSLIFKLLVQQWFLNSVNKGILEANISNKILMNSKIKKKLFHLKVARILLHSDASDPKQYKKNVSKQANAIALEIKEDDQLFEHPSAIIYLLNFFLSCLKTVFQNEFRNREVDQDLQASHDSNERQVNSKEQFKNLIKSIIAMFNRIKVDRETLDYAEHFVSVQVNQRALEINKKYELTENVPSWDYFTQVVIAKCFQFKKDGLKITNSMLNQWILEFKQKTNQLGLTYQSYVPNSGQLKFFTPIIIISPPQE